MFKKWLVLFSIFFLGVILGGAGILFISPFSFQPITQDISSTPSPGIIAGTQHEKAMVKRVIDGDTIELADGRKVRYTGIDTPETVDPRKPVACFGKEASDKNKALVLGKVVELEKDISEIDKFGRLLRYVYVDVGGQLIMVNEELVRQGYATNSTFPPDIKYQDLFQGTERQARQGNLGLWSACSITSDSLQSATPAANLNNEILRQAQDKQSNNGGCLIKGNIGSTGEKIYHLPGCESYEKTSIDPERGERWFCTEEEAIEAGWRKAKNC